MKPNKLQHKEGLSFSGAPFWLGLFSLALATSVFYLSESTILRIIAGLAGIWGIISLPAIISVEFDLNQRLVKKYYYFILFKYPYETLDLSKIESIELKLYTDTNSHNMLSISTTVRTRVFELYALRKDQKTLIAESTDYKYATKLLHELSEGLQIPGHDLYAEWRSQLKSKQRRL